ncbi:MAG: DUF131 domain-containing protein [Candidatus Nanohaloarchaea archaeon]|nr:DUF131 domain-containing protein [Candidatus Nanohaloarchaea archaeon]
MDGGHLTAAGILLILAGFGLVLVGGVLGGDGDVAAGGVVFLGPIPIVAGTSPRMVGLSLGLGAVMLVLLWLGTKGL